MIIPKMLINAVATQLVKHFRLDKIMSYVFDDNELDVKFSKLNKRVKALESEKCICHQVKVHTEEKEGDLQEKKQKVE
jgi:hypothetical protein|tara:strand:+ start:215 stop:448 length:234 start_codon:yes stop_codon:yes gene_type:complete